MNNALNKLSILVVDQNVHIRQLMLTILQQLGAAKIEAVATADAGFERYCASNYDVVFTDSDLAPFSGYELIDLIRTSPHSPHPYVPIIMLSAHSDSAHVRQARDHGVTEFLAKPFTVDIVLKRLQAVIEKPRPFVRAGSYFGPDRRRKSSLDYNGPERRKSLLDKVKLSKSDITRQQRSALAKNKHAIDGVRGD